MLDGCSISPLSLGLSHGRPMRNENINLWLDIFLALLISRFFSYVYKNPTGFLAIKSINSAHHINECCTLIDEFRTKAMQTDSLVVQVDVSINPNKNI